MTTNPESDPGAPPFHLAELPPTDAQLLFYALNDAIAYASDLEGTCRADGFFRHAEILRGRRESYERIKRELPRLRFRVLEGGRR